MRVSISQGNNKMGSIHSVSQPPIITCKHCKYCGKDCYANRLYKFRKSVKKAYDNNYDMALNHREEYFSQIIEHCKTQAFFRWHVSGDIIDENYFDYMIYTANVCSNCQFLVFTKNFEIVNETIKIGIEIPENLHIIFSNWQNFKCDNPHNLPTTDVIDKIEDLPKNAKLCSGNCTNCICRNIGCWNLQKGETLYFLKH